MTVDKCTSKGCSVNQSSLLVQTKNDVINLIVGIGNFVYCFIGSVLFPYVLKDIGTLRYKRTSSVYCTNLQVTVQFHSFSLLSVFLSTDLGCYRC